MKRCSSCKAEVEKSNFYANNQSKDGLGFYCKSCVKVKSAHWRDGKKHHRLEYNRKWRRENPEKYREILGKHSAKMRSVLYGVSHEDFNRMLADQGGMCAMGHPFGDSRICVDHDHKTGVVRGLLCSRHNLALGMFEDSQEHLSAAVAYLQKSVQAVSK